MDSIIAKDLPEFHNILTNLHKHVSESIIGITQLHEKISNNVNRDKGLSFLEMKCQLFLEYLINIVYSMLLKIDGKQLAGEPCIENLVEIRTVLSKIRPIEKKLKYQIDKLVKMASPDAQNTDQHALNFKPNIDNLAGKDEDETEKDDEGSEEEDGGEKNDVYVPPKLTAVHYDGDKLSREEKKLEKARQRSLNTNLLADMREEFGDEPVEISDVHHRSMQRKLKEKMDERQRYEEDNLKRLMVSKKDKMMKRKLTELDEVIKIGRIGGLGDEDSDNDEMPMPKSKKKKGKRFGGGKGKFKKRMQRKGK